MEQKPDSDNFTTQKVNPILREYYFRVLELSEADFASFWQILQDQLPVVFRINPLHNNYQNLIKSFVNSTFLPELFSQGNLIKLKPISWYPNQLVWQVNSNRSELRKQANIKEFHSFLQKASDSGLITRQELVSMIPPLVLQATAGEKILDMCAAPGSKTAQLIELMEGKGLVVANDVDTNRAYMLIHQLHRSNTSSMVVVNHQAQNFPRIDFEFDKILCDVPCSGDGAIRKLPIKWRKWNVRDGQVLHPLQITIFRRGVQLLKPGGIICYSTCSLNPIEDEAVVNTIVKEFDLEILNLPEMLSNICPGLIVRKGLNRWKVLGNAKEKVSGQFIEYSCFEDVPEHITTIKQSMFPNNPVPGLENTIRVLPHDQNTGGFYIALFKKKTNIQLPVKVSPIRENEDVPAEIIDEVIAKPKKKRKILDMEQPLYVPIQDNGDYINITSVFGLDALPITQLLAPLTKSFKNLFFVSPEVKEFLDKDAGKILKVLNVGVCAFTKNKHNPTKSICVYRPHQDALPFISEFITKKRLFSDNLDYLKILLKNGNFETEEFLHLGNGYYIMKFNEIQEEVLVLKVSDNKFQTVVPREHIDSLRIRYPILK